MKNREIENDSIFCALLLESVEQYTNAEIIEHFNESVKNHSEYAFVYGLTVEYVRKKPKSDVFAQTLFKQSSGIEVVKASYGKRKYYTSKTSITHLFRSLIEVAKNKYHDERQIEYSSSRFFTKAVRTVINECFDTLCKKYTSVITSKIGEIK